jgi:hypothetical protein
MNWQAEQSWVLNLIRAGFASEGSDVGSDVGGDVGNLTSRAQIPTVLTALPAASDPGQSAAG